MRARVTVVGWLVLAIVALLYGASITSQSVLLLVPAGILLGCFGVNFLSAWRTLRSLEISAPNSAHVVEGQRLDQPWQVRNTNRCDVALISAESAAGSLFKLPQLVAGTATGVIPELVFARRGVFPHDQLRLTTAFPFGLVRVARRLALVGEVVVHPAVYPTPPPRAAGSMSWWAESSAGVDRRAVATSSAVCDRTKPAIHCGKSIGPAVRRASV